MNVMSKTKVVLSPIGYGQPKLYQRICITAGQLIPVKGYLLTFVQVRLGGEIHD